MNKSSFISKEIITNEPSDAEKINKIADDILSYSRNALIVDMRFLSSAFCKLKPKKAICFRLQRTGNFYITIRCILFRDTNNRKSCRREIFYMQSCIAFFATCMQIMRLIGLSGILLAIFLSKTL